MDGKSDLDLSAAELFVVTGSVCFCASETCYCLLLPSYREAYASKR